LALIVCLYVGAALWLALYGVNALGLTALFLRQRGHHRQARKTSPISPPQWPLVTVQLPVYNEQQVVRRLTDAVARLDYPRDRLHIQVLDDSTDGTTELAAERVAYWQSRGRWITLHHRVDRVDYKAGALCAALTATPGEFIAIFDADFVPPPGWLKRALQPFLEPGGKRIGLVQTRWSHLNAEYSLLTRAQALALDGHFGIEQPARHWAGLLFNFNGTAGIWRRGCIESTGGWRGVTLSEDLDLSYRAQLQGWTFRYLPDVTAPAEIPPLMPAFKRQQFRWAKGSIQCARLLGPALLRAPISRWRKLQGVAHLTSYLVHPLMVLLLLVTLPMSLGDGRIFHHLPLAWLGIAGLGAPLLYAAAQWSLYPGTPWWRRLAWLPLLAILGTGIAASNTRAVIEGLSGLRSPFQRTPKTGLERRGGHWEGGAAERIDIDVTTWVELALSVYALVAGTLALVHGNWIGVFFLAIYGLGFAWVGGATLWEAHAWRPRQQSHRPLQQVERL